MAYQSINPYNETVLKTYDDITDAALESSVSRAQRTFTSAWSREPMAHRAAVLLRAATLMRERSAELARYITLEMGKLINESLGEVALSADILEYYAKKGPAMLAAQQLIMEEGEASVESEPLGVLFCVEPWNFPYYQLARVAGPSLILGNVLLVKHASNVPQCAEAFERILIDAGAAQGVYTNLFASKGQIARLIADDRIKAVALTGSEAAGAIVAAQAGKALKKSTMELGGSDAFIVLEDADLDRAVSWAVWGRINNTGQCCIAAKRFIVVEKVADEFLRRFKASLELLKVGDPLDPSTTLGPMSSEGAAQELAKQVETAVAHGAKRLLGGGRLARKGAFVEAGILTDITPDNPVFHQEFFGPVAMFFRVQDEQAAIALANDSPFGLGGSVFTQDIERGKRVARQIATGMVFINQATWTAPDLPFGGIKNSGYGRELAYLGMQEFVNKKLIRVSAASPPSEFPVAAA